MKQKFTQRLTENRNKYLNQLVQKIQPVFNNEVSIQSNRRPGTQQTLANTQSGRGYGIDNIGQINDMSQDIAGAISARKEAEVNSIQQSP